MLGSKRKQELGVAMRCKIPSGANQLGKVKSLKR